MSVDPSPWAELNGTLPDDERPPTEELLRQGDEQNLLEQQEESRKGREWLMARRMRADGGFIL